MKTRTKILIAIIAVVVLLIFWVMGSYNSLVSLNENVDSQWQQVETQYQRRVDLIPNLVNTVKGYAAHEQELFTEITELRSQWQSAGSVNEKVETAGQIESALSRLLVVVENYPELKANQNFLSLQDELAGTENRIAVERMRFNEAVRDYNVRIKRFPTRIIAGMFGFEERNYFESEEGAENAPVVEF